MNYEHVIPILIWNSIFFLTKKLYKHQQVLEHISGSMPHPDCKFPACKFPACHHLNAWFYHLYPWGTYQSNQEYNKSQHKDPSSMNFCPESIVLNIHLNSFAKCH
jgi:hypothetical protein